MRSQAHVLTLYSETILSVLIYDFPVSLKTFLHPRYWYAWPVLALLVCRAWLPVRLLWVLGSGLGWLFSLLPSPSCRIAARNIELCFPELSAAERQKLVQRHFRDCGLAVLSLGITFFAPALEDQAGGPACGPGALRCGPRRGKEHHPAGASLHHASTSEGCAPAMIKAWSACTGRPATPCWNTCSSAGRRTGAVLVDRLANLKSLIRYIREGHPSIICRTRTWASAPAYSCRSSAFPAATVTALSRIAQSTNAAVVPCVSRILPDGQGFEVRFYPALREFPDRRPCRRCRPHEPRDRAMGARDAGAVYVVLSPLQDAAQP